MSSAIFHALFGWMRPLDHAVVGGSTPPRRRSARERRVQIGGGGLVAIALLLGVLDYLQDTPGATGSAVVYTASNRAS